MVENNNTHALYCIHKTNHQIIINKIYAIKEATKFSFLVFYLFIYFFFLVSKSCR